LLQSACDCGLSEDGVVEFGEVGAALGLVAGLLPACGFELAVGEAEFAGVWLVTGGVLCTCDALPLCDWSCPGALCCCNIDIICGAGRSSCVLLGLTLLLEGLAVLPGSLHELATAFTLEACTVFAVCVVVPLERVASSLERSSDSVISTSRPTIERSVLSSPFT